MYTTQADIERKKFSKCNLNTAYLKLLTLRAVQLLLRLVMRLTFFVKFVRDVDQALYFRFETVSFRSPLLSDLVISTFSIVLNPTKLHFRNIYK